MPISQDRILALLEAAEFLREELVGLSAKAELALQRGNPTELVEFVQSTSINASVAARQHETLLAIERVQYNHTHKKNEYLRDRKRRQRLGMFPKNYFNTNLNEDGSPTAGWVRRAQIEASQRSDSQFAHEALESHADMFDSQGNLKPEFYTEDLKESTESEQEFGKRISKLDVDIVEDDELESPEESKL